MFRRSRMVAATAAGEGSGQKARSFCLFPRKSAKHVDRIALPRSHDDDRLKPASAASEAPAAPAAAPAALAAATLPPAAPAGEAPAAGSPPPSPKPPATPPAPQLLAPLVRGNAASRPRALTLSATVAVSQATSNSAPATDTATAPTSASASTTAATNGTSSTTGCAPSDAATSPAALRAFGSPVVAGAAPKSHFARPQGPRLSPDEIGTRLPPGPSPRAIKPRAAFRSVSVSGAAPADHAEVEEEDEELGSHLPSVRRGRKHTAGLVRASSVAPVRSGGPTVGPTVGPTSWRGADGARPDAANAASSSPDAEESVTPHGAMRSEEGEESAMACLLRSVSNGRRFREVQGGVSVAFEGDEGGRLHKWLAAARSGDVAVQREAARKLRFYSKEKLADGNVVEVEGGLEALAGLLECDDSTTAEYAVTALLNLSLIRPVRARLGVPRLLAAVARVLERGSARAKANAAAALFTLAETDAQRVAAKEAGAILSLVALADEDPWLPASEAMEDAGGDADDVLHGRKAVGESACAGQQQPDSERATGLVKKGPSVVHPKLCASATVAVSTPAAAEAAAAAAAAGGFARSSLSQSSSMSSAHPPSPPSASPLRAAGADKRSSARRDALLALLKLCACEEVRQEVLERKGMALAVRMVREGGEEVEEEAVGLLSTLVRSLAGCCAAVEEEGLQALVEILEVGSDLSKELAVAGLHAVGLQGAKFVNVLRGLGCRPVLMIVEETGTKKAQKKASLILKMMASQQMKRPVARTKLPELSLRDELMSVSLVGDEVHTGFVH